MRPILSAACRSNRVRIRKPPNSRQSQLRMQRSWHLGMKKCTHLPPKVHARSKDNQSESGSICTPNAHVHAHRVRSAQTSTPAYLQVNSWTPVVACTCLLCYHLDICTDWCVRKECMYPKRNRQMQVCVCMCACVYTVHACLEAPVSTNFRVHACMRVGIG